MHPAQPAALNSASGPSLGNPAPQDAGAVRVELAFRGIEGAEILEAGFFGMKHKFFGDRARPSANTPSARSSTAGRTFCRVERSRGIPTSHRNRRSQSFAFRCPCPKRAGEDIPSFAGRLIHREEPGLQCHAVRNRRPCTRPARSARERDPEAGELRIVRRFENRSREFVPSLEQGILAGGQALRFAKIMCAITKSGISRRNSLDTGIENRCCVAVSYSAAGKAAILIGAARSGRQCDGHVFPNYHVGADCVRPVHVTPNGGARVELKKHVVVAVPEDGSVRIVHPVVRREQMELRAKRIGGQARSPGIFFLECAGEWQTGKRRSR